MQFGRARNLQFHFAEQFIVGINERHLHFNRFAHARIGKVICDSLSIGFVRQLFPDLRQVVLTIRILDVPSEFGPFLHQMTPTTEQVARRAHLGGIDIRLGNQPATQ